MGWRRTLGWQLFLCAGDRQAADGGRLIQLSAGVPAGKLVRQWPAVCTEPSAQHPAGETSGWRRHLRHRLAWWPRQVISHSVLRKASTRISFSVQALGEELVICSIARFRNQISGCNYPGTRTRFQLLSKERKTTMQWHVHTQLPNIVIFHIKLP